MRYKTIVAILSFITSIFIVLFLALQTPTIKNSLKFTFWKHNEIEMDYQFLKEYAIQIANGEYDRKYEDIEVSYDIGEDFFTIELKKKFYGVSALFPIKNYSKNMKKPNIISFSENLDCKNVIFFENKYIEPISYYISVSIIILIILTILVYSFYYYILYKIIELLK